jgi:hypothetical protein
VYVCGINYNCGLFLLFLVDLSSWHKKISEEMALEFDDEDIEVGETVEVSVTNY